MNQAEKPETHVTFIEKHSLAIRLWHWITFVTITSSLVLVLLGSTMFKTKDNIGLVQEQLEKKGAMVTKDQARSVAHEYSDKLWMTHKYVGYGLCFLILCRIIIEFAQSTEEKLKTRIGRMLRLGTSAMEKKGRWHYLFVKEGYLIFYLLIFVMGLTGFGLAFEDTPWLEDIQDPIKTVHKIVQYFIYAYILVHLVGVISADAGKYPGIVSGMIHKKNPNG